LSSLKPTITSQYEHQKAKVSSRRGIYRHTAAFKEAEIHRGEEKKQDAVKEAYVREARSLLASGAITDEKEIRIR